MRIARNLEDELCLRAGLKRRWIQEGQKGWVFPQPDQVSLCNGLILYQFQTLTFNLNAREKKSYLFAFGIGDLKTCTSQKPTQQWFVYCFVHYSTDVVLCALVYFLNLYPAFGCLTQWQQRAYRPMNMKGLPGRGTFPFNPDLLLTKS